MTDPDTHVPDYVFGLDLGRRQDYSALALLERTAAPDPLHPERLWYHFGVRFLHRWPLDTPYPTIVQDVVRMVAGVPKLPALLAVDETGVGSAVVDMLVAAQPRAAIHPVLITSGHQVTKDGRSWHVPKKQLVSTLDAQLQSRRLKVAPVPERELLLKEFGAFTVKITAAAKETFESWRERDHDDLVLAVALAAWLGERVHPEYRGPVVLWPPVPMPREAPGRGDPAARPRLEYESADGRIQTFTYKGIDITFDDDETAWYRR